jgi:transcriptional regulator with XRE-family HTH domain
MKDCPIDSEVVEPVLAAVLRSLPPGPLSKQSLRALAASLAYGLHLSGFAPPDPAASGQCDSSVLAANIRALRKSLGCTQAEFAAIVLCDQPSVSRWEKNGVEPGGISLAIMAELAGCGARAFILSPWVSKNKAAPHVIRVAPVALPGEAEIAQIVTHVLENLPAGLPYSEWPRVVAAEVNIRLQILAADRAGETAGNA